MKNFLIIYILFALPLLGQTSSNEEKSPPDKLRFRVGTIFVDFDTNFAFSPQRGGIGGLVNFEDLLGLEGSQSSFRFEGKWRIKEKSYLVFGYQKLSRNGGRSPERTFEFLDYTLSSGLEVVTDFDASFLTLAYRYNAYDNDEVKLFGLAGFTHINLFTKIHAGLGVIGPDGNVLGEEFTSDADMSAPVPVIGVGTEWAVNNKFETELYFRGVSVNVGDFKGALSEIGLAGTWFVSEHIGIGFGVEKIDLRIKEYEGEDYKIRGAYSQIAAKLYLEFAF